MQDPVEGGQEPLRGPETDALLQDYRDRAEAAEEARERAENGLRLALVDLENAEVGMRSLRRQVTELKNRLHEKETKGSYAREIELVFGYWQRRCGHPRTVLGTERATVVKRRLEEHGVLECLYAVDGAALAAFVSVDNGKRHDELELIMRNEVKFDAFRSRRALAIRNGKLGPVLTYYCLPPGTRRATYSLEHEGWRFKCPVCRHGWAEDHWLPLTVGRRGEGWCSALCSGSLSLDELRAGLLELPASCLLPGTSDAPPEGEASASA